LELDIDLSDFEKQFSEEEMKEKIKRSMEAMAIEWEGEAKRIVSDNSVDTGDFLNSIHYEMLDGEEIGFVGYDGVSYGKYWEFGTISHWLPFFWYGDTSKPVLADWGRRVLKLSDQEMLDMGGITVELDELMPFRKALTFVEAQAGDIFREEFEK